MKSIIVCEGLTDCLFIQYYMRKVHNWQDDRESNNVDFLQWKRSLKKGENELLIGHNGSSSKLINALNDILERNYWALENELYNKVVIITDRDDDILENNIISKIKENVSLNGGIIRGDLKNDEWINIDFINSIGEKITISFLILVIPLDENGAIENVLLDSISDNNSYDRGIIEKSKDFVDNIDYEKRYLKKRRHILKARFNVFFSIRVPEDFYTERQKIFMGFPWESNQQLRNVFSNLDNLNN